MKIFAFTLLLMIGFVPFMVAQTKIIEHPTVESSNTNALDILKIERSPKETIVWMDIYYPSDNNFSIPATTVLESVDGKRVYKLLRTEGVEIGKWTYTSAQGYLSCKLIFEPLDACEEAVNYKEGTVKYPWRLNNISLMPVNVQKGQVQTLLKGKVVDRPNSSRLILLREGDDDRVVGIYIPIRDGKFEYLLHTDEQGVYSLIFEDERMRGAWRPIDFFAEGKTVRFVLYPMDEWEKNEIQGGKEDQKYRNYLKVEKKLISFDEERQKMEDLYEAGKYRTLEVEALYKQLDGADRSVRDSLYGVLGQLRRERKDLTPEALAVSLAMDKKIEKLHIWKIDYARSHVGLSGYYILLESFQRVMDDSEIADWKERQKPVIRDVFEKIYRPLFPKHSITNKFATGFEALENIYVGGQFIDFSAPDMFTGKDVRVSEHIRGKIALIDLWASWCGPCRRHAQAMIPVYEKYKDKGFTIIGVARESCLDDGVAAARKDKYPWVNLIELKDKNDIWNKYGLGNSGGGQFLVDADGKILAISPTPDEVVKLIEKAGKD